MADCSGIFQGAIYDCDNQPIGGVRETLTLINFGDIAGITTNGNVISGITLVDNAVAYEFQGIRQSLVPESHFIPGRFSVGYDHQVAFQVFDKTQLSKDNMERLGFRKTVAIVQNSDLTYEVYGIANGLELLNNDRLPADQDTSGSFTIVLKTSDNTAREPKLPQTFFTTDQATTDAAVAALVNRPIVVNISPIAGAAAGGTAFTISGDNYQLNGSSNISSVDWIDAGMSATNQAAFTVDSNTQISIASSVALSAGTYSIRVTSNQGGIGQSGAVVVIT